MSHDTQATPAPAASKFADRLIFGLTITQLDDLRRYVAFLVADGDMLMNAPDPCDAKTVPTLGESIYGTALATREIIDTLEDQRASADQSDARPVARSPRHRRVAAHSDQHARRRPRASRHQLRAVRDAGQAGR